MKEQRMTLQQKSNYIGLDIFKIIGAFLVVAIHIHPLESYWPQGSYVLTEIICRVAVPIFFLCSGFFLGNKLAHWESTRAYILHILKMYGLWTILYFPQMIHRFWDRGESVAANVLRLIQRITLIGSYIQLWYLLATVVAVVILYLLLHALHLHTRSLLGITFALYLIGMLGNAYSKLTMMLPYGTMLLHGYRKLFFTTRNGLFFGLFFITLGYVIGTNRDKVKKQPYFLWGILCVAGMYLEDWLIRHTVGEGSHDMYLFTVLAAVFLFLGFCFWNIDDRKQAVGVELRKYSTDVFLVHLLVNFYGKKLLACLGLQVPGSMPWFILVVMMSLLISWVLQRAGRRR